MPTLALGTHSAVTWFQELGGRVLEWRRQSAIRASNPRVWTRRLSRMTPRYLRAVCTASQCALAASTPLGLFDDAGFGCFW